MTTEKQKDLERFYLDKFLEVVQIEPKSVENGSEPPDFFLDLNGERIAAEVKEYHLSQRLRAAEETWRKISEFFREQCKDDLLRLFGIVFFKDKLRFPPKNKHREFSAQLAAFATSVRTQLTEQSQKFTSFLPGFPLLAMYLDKIHLQLCTEPHNELLESNYNCGSIGLSEANLLKTLAKKQHVSATGDITESWLLIVSSYRISQSAGPLRVNVLNGFTKVGQALLSVSYDKVYLFSYMYDNVVLWDQHNKAWREITPFRLARPTLSD